MPRPRTAAACSLASNTRPRRTTSAGSSSAFINKRAVVALSSIAASVADSPARTTRADATMPSSDGRGRRRLSARRETVTESLSEGELAKEADLVIRPTVGAADRSVRCRDEPVVRAVTLVNDGEVERVYGFVIHSDVEIMVLQRRIYVAAGPYPVISAEDPHLRREGERTESRPAVRFVVGDGRHIVPVFRREIL